MGKYLASRLLQTIPTVFFGNGRRFPYAAPVARRSGARIHRR